MRANRGNEIFELNGEFFTDREVAVTKACETIESVAESIVSKLNAGKIAEVRYDQFVAEEPSGAIVIEGAFQLDPLVPVGATPLPRRGTVGFIVSLCIYLIDPASQTKGQYVAKKWTIDELNHWRRFAFDALDDDFRSCTPAEMHYVDVAHSVTRARFAPEHVSGLLSDLAMRWENTTTDHERSELAEILLCAWDIGLPVTLHDVLHLCPKLGERAEELQRTREIATGSRVTLAQSRAG